MFGWKFVKQRYHSVISDSYTKRVINITSEVKQCFHTKMASSEMLNFDSLKIENYLAKYFPSKLTKDEEYHFEKVPNLHRPTRKQKQEISSAQYRNQMKKVKLDIHSSFLSMENICQAMKKKTKDEWNDLQTQLGLARITLSKINFILNVSVEQSEKEDRHWSKFIRTALKLYIARLELDNEEVEVAMKTNTQEVAERFEASESATDPAEQEIFIKNLFKSYCGLIKECPNKRQ